MPTGNGLVGALSTLALATTAFAQSYPVVDTGQERCYNASTEITCPAPSAPFYGQDAQHTGNAPSYTLSGDGLTVYDDNTGLTWQHTTDTNGDGVIDATDKLTWAGAQARPAALNTAQYGGYDDWRLPTIKELYSLIDFRGTDPSGLLGNDTSGLIPFIATTYFDFAYGDTSAGERIIDAQYASSTVYVSHTANDGGSTLFGVNFADGRIKGYGLTLFGADKTFFVQCVRGNASYGVNAFVDNGDQTVTDGATGLMWTRSDSGSAMNWQDALTWVQTKNSANYLGYSDWRLPNAKELQSILDYTRSPDTTQSAALDPIFDATSFLNEGGQADWPWYWASTTHAAYNGAAASAVYLAFGRAVGWQKSPPTAACYTLFDVHGAGAQRGDPKTSSGLVAMGTACSGGTAYGLGPQGDTQRAANYVRLVRDAGGGIPPWTPTPTPASPTLTPAITATPQPTVTPACAALPVAGCRTPAVGGKAFLRLKDKAPDDAKDLLQWKWLKGAATGRGDFGTPLSSTDYRLCIYDASSLILDAAIPAGGLCRAARPTACWKEKAHGFDYRDKDLTPDGIEQLMLREGAAGKARITFKGKGTLLDDPALPLAQPVTVQLLHAGGICWQAVYSAPALANTEGPPGQFKDKAD